MGCPTDGISTSPRAGVVIPIITRASTHAAPRRMNSPIIGTWPLPLGRLLAELSPLPTDALALPFQPGAGHLGGLRIDLIRIRKDRQGSGPGDGLLDFLGSRTRFGPLGDLRLRARVRFLSVLPHP